MPKKWDFDLVQPQRVSGKIHRPDSLAVFRPKFLSGFHRRQNGAASSLSWRASLNALHFSNVTDQCDILAANDFTTLEVWSKSGLVTVYLLFVMELKTRRVHFAGCTTSPDEQFMKQVARERLRGLLNYYHRDAV